MSHDDLWPSLPLNEWLSTYETLHMLTQIVGKIRTKLSPPANHWWNSALYVTPRGLTTSAIPFAGEDFDITFDFIDHAFIIQKSDGQERTLALTAKPVATFFKELMDTLSSLDIRVEIDPVPKEVPNPIRCDEDFVHKSYDADYVHRLWRIFIQVDRLMKTFRADFEGKCSPVHFFWGSFDLAVTRFNGKRAPLRPEADSITREAYSHEVISCGFWPGSGNIAGPAFYAYAAPEPDGYAKSVIRPRESFYNLPTKGFILMYDDVRKSQDPDEMVLQFFQDTYAAAADLAQWDRKSLERS